MPHQARPGRLRGRRVRQRLERALCPCRLPAGRTLGSASQHQFSQIPEIRRRQIFSDTEAPGEDTRAWSHASRKLWPSQAGATKNIRLTRTRPAPGHPPSISPRFAGALSAPFSPRCAGSRPPRHLCSPSGVGPAHLGLAARRAAGERPSSPSCRERIRSIRWINRLGPLLWRPETKLDGISEPLTPQANQTRSRCQCSLHTNQRQYAPKARVQAGV